MASQYDPRDRATEHPCTNAPDPHVLRTSQTLQAEAEILSMSLNPQEHAPQAKVLFACLQARFG